MKKNPNISIGKLKELISYDAETGVFVRLKNSTKARAGDRADLQEPTGYMRVWLCGQRVYAHRLAWFYVHGDWPTNEIDHINRDKKDNRIANLRDVSRSINQRNRPIWGEVSLRGVRVMGGQIPGSDFSQWQHKIFR